MRRESQERGSRRGRYGDEKWCAQQAVRGFVDLDENSLVVGIDRRDDCEARERAKADGCYEDTSV